MLCVFWYTLWPVFINTSAFRKRTTTYNEKRDYHSVLQKFGEIYDVKYY